MVVQLLSAPAAGGPRRAAAMQVAAGLPGAVLLDGAALRIPYVYSGSVATADVELEWRTGRLADRTIRTDGATIHMTLL